MKVRRSVLNMPLKMWISLDQKYGKHDAYEITPNEFEKEIGKPNGLSGIYNEDDKEWFSVMYKKPVQKSISIIDTSI